MPTAPAGQRRASATATPPTCTSAALTRATCAAVARRPPVCPWMLTPAVVAPFLAGLQVVHQNGVPRLQLNAVRHLGQGRRVPQKPRDGALACLQARRADTSSSGPVWVPQVVPICPQSCGVCTTVCIDKDESCRGWATTGECTREESKNFMVRPCSASHDPQRTCHTRLDCNRPKPAPPPADCATIWRSLGPPRTSSEAMPYDSWNSTPRDPRKRARTLTCRTRAFWTPEALPPPGGPQGEILPRPQAQCGQSSRAMPSVARRSGRVEPDPGGLKSCACVVFVHSSSNWRPFVQREGPERSPSIPFPGRGPCSLELGARSLFEPFESVVSDTPLGSESPLEGRARPSRPLASNPTTKSF